MRACYGPTVDARNIPDSAWIEMTRLLLLHGAQPNLPAVYGITPLHVAAQFSAEVVRMLLQAGASIPTPDTASTSTTTTTTTAASTTGRDQTIQYSPVHVAILTNRLDVLRVLDEHGLVSVTAKVPF